MTSITVVVTTYNSANTINECLLSIPNQIHGLNVNILVIDDHSSDSTIAIIRELSIDTLTIYTNEENFGIGYSRTKALILAKTPYLLFLDSDDTFQTLSINIKNINFPEAADLIFLKRYIPSRISSQTKIENSLSCIAPFPSVDKSEVIFEIYNSTDQFLSEIWGIIFSTSYLRLTSSAFPSLRIYEDLCFASHLLQSGFQWSYSDSYGIKKSNSIGISRSASVATISCTFEAFNLVSSLTLSQKTKCFHEYYQRISKHLLLELSRLTCLPDASPHQISHISNSIHHQYKQAIVSYRKSFSSNILNILEHVKSEVPIYLWFAAPYSLVVAKNLAVHCYNIECFIDDARNGHSYEVSTSNTCIQIPVLTIESIPTESITIIIPTENHQLAKKVLQKSRKHAPTALIYLFSCE